MPATLLLAEEPALVQREELMCMDTERVMSYTVETDRLVRFSMKNAPDILMTIKGFCPQLKYHQYFTYTPTNGMICTTIHDITTRAGMPCKIETLAFDTPHPDTESQAN
ncbi:hypothetical protein [Kordiimonas sediminis]|nr:hypothetical protein [Kordiimonas sediminis]